PRSTLFPYTTLFRSAVHHDGLVARVGERERGGYAGVVEFNPLADAVRPAASDEQLGRRAFVYLGPFVVGRVQVRGAGRELRGAGVDRVIHRPHAQPPADLAHRGLEALAQLGNLRVGEPGLFRQLQRRRVQRGGRGDLLRHLLDVLDLLDEPGIDAGHADHVSGAGAGPKGLVDGG